MLCVCCCVVCLHCFVSPYVFLGLSCLFVWCVCLSIFVLFVCAHLTVLFMRNVHVHVY